MCAVVYRLPTKVQTECSENFAAQSANTRGLAATPGLTWGRSVFPVRSWSTLTARGHFNGIRSTIHCYFGCYNDPFIIQYSCI